MQRNMKRGLRAESAHPKSMQKVNVSVDSRDYLETTKRMREREGGGGGRERGSLETRSSSSKQRPTAQDA